MNYQLFINNNLLIQGDIFLAICLGVVSLVILILLLIWIINMLGSNEAMRYEFITIVAHKFRTPLTQIKWMIEGMVGGETDPYKKQSLTEIRQSNEGLIKLTNSLIEITERDSKGTASYVFDRLNVCDIVKSVAESTKKSFHEKNIFFGVECPPEEVYIKADRSRLEFVIETMLENACAYTPPGRNVDLSVSISRSKVSIAVIDTGIGIKAEDMPHIFSKFFRSKDAQSMDTEGFGVGLYLSRSVVRRHHGKMEVHSGGKDLGATFVVTLPRIKK